MRAKQIVYLSYKANYEENKCNKEQSPRCLPGGHEQGGATDARGTAPCLDPITLHALAVRRLEMKSSLCKEKEENNPRTNNPIQEVGGGEEESNPIQSNPIQSKFHA
jgi:hypothetical protein